MLRSLSSVKRRHHRNDQVSKAVRSALLRVESLEARTLLSTGPMLESINRLQPVNTVAAPAALTFRATFSEPVSGVDPSDFRVIASGGATASPTVSIVAESGSIYDVTVSAVTGPGAVRLDLVNNRSIHDSAAISLIGANDTFQYAAPVEIPLTGDSNNAPGRPLAVGDFNSDGKPDFVVGTSDGNSANVYLSDGSGGFAAPISLTPKPDVSVNTFGMTTGDFDGDGNLDLITTDNGQLAVFRGLGNGHFSAQVTFAAGVATSTPVVADFNHDGLSDVAVGNSANGGLTIYFGNATTLLASPVTFSTGSAPGQVASGDFNGDGNADLIVNGPTNIVKVLLGDGHGNFTAGPSLTIDAPPTSLSAHDVDADGRSDILATADPLAVTSSTVDVFSGNSDGTFKPLVRSAISQTQGPLAFVDLNNDGLPDIIQPNGGGFSVLTNVGGDQFKPTQNLEQAVLADSVGVADFNHDGIPDVLMTSDQSPNATLLLGQGASFVGQTYTILPPVRVTSINRETASAITSADSVTYRVNFSTPVKGVDPANFQTVTSGGVAAGAISVSALSTSSYDVTVAGIHGNGTVQLNLVDNGSITDLMGHPLGTGQPFGGSFSGQAYTIAQTFPRVIGIDRSAPLSPAIGDQPVTYQVLFNESVTGVDASDFQVVTTDGVTYTNPLVVSGNGQTYFVTINGIDGTGNVTLNLKDIDSIHDLNGNPLANASGQQSLGAAVVRTTFSVPISVAVADVNLDRIPDRVWTTSGAVFVELGNGDGTFGTPIRSLWNPTVQNIMIADFNGDGIPDIVGQVADLTPNAYNVLAIGSGDGTFKAPVNIIPTPATAGELQAGDFNNDGYLDLLVATSAGDQLLLNNGVGGFKASPTLIPAGTSLNVADLDGDGIPDIVGTGGAFVNDGSGNFTLASPAFNQQIVRVGDFNGDGSADVLAVGAYQYQVWLGNGAGQLVAGGVQNFSGGGGITEVEVADLNQDGISDIAFTTASGGPGPFGTADTGAIDTAFGQPGGFLTPPTMHEVGTVPGNFVLADLNGDGLPDLTTTVADGIASAINVHGDLGASIVVPNNFQTSFSSIATADFNGDGRSDLVVAGQEQFTDDGIDFHGFLGVDLANADGSYTEAANVEFPDNAFGPVSVGDVNGDGVPDVVYDGSLFFGTTDGQLLLQSSSDSLGSSGTVAIADFNGDGRADVVTPGNILFGNGDGTFQPPIPLGVNTNQTNVIAADINGDGNLDLIFDDSTVTVELGNGSGGFTAPVQVVASTDAGTLTTKLADFDRDGKLDLLVTDSLAPGQVKIYPGNGNATFGSPRTFNVGGTDSIAVGDINGDGFPDFIGSSANGIFVSLNTGNGSLSTPTEYAPSGLVAVADANGDGKADIVFAHTGHLTGGGSEQVNSSGIGAIFGIATGDFSGDTYRVVQPADSIIGTSANDFVTLSQDPDHIHIDWQMGSTYGQMAINDPAGLRIFGDGGVDHIFLNYANGNPLPLKTFMSGQFFIDNFQTTDTLANRTIDIDGSRVWVTYSSAATDPINALRSFLRTGYNGGLWNGVGSSTGGAFVSQSALRDSTHIGIGYIDSASGLNPRQPPNSIFLQATPYGDTSISGLVGFSDVTRLVQHFGQTNATWSDGDFNYDGTVNYADFMLLSQNYAQVASAAILPPVQPPIISSDPSTSTKKSKAPKAVAKKLKVGVKAAKQAAKADAKAAKSDAKKGR